MWVLLTTNMTSCNVAGACFAIAFTAIDVALGKGNRNIPHDIAGTAIVCIYKHMVSIIINLTNILFFVLLRVIKQDYK